MKCHAALPWHEITKRLRGVEERIPSEYWRHIKAYSEKGVPLPKPKGIWIEPTYIKLLELWLASEASSCKHIFWGDLGPIKEVRKQFRVFYSEMSYELAKDGDKSYGVMGGIEQDIILDLNRGISEIDEVDYGGQVLQSGCDNPCVLVSQCATSTDQEIRNYDREPYRRSGAMDFKYIANRPGLVLWDKISEIMEYDPNSIYLNYSPDDRITKKRLWKTMNGLQSFSFSSCSRANTKEYVTGLLDKFESNQFSGNLMTFWYEANKMVS